MEKYSLPHSHISPKKAGYLKDQLSQDEDFSAVAEVFRLLDDTNRVKIFWLLCHCEECVSDISALMGMSSPAVSHHLRLLKEAGLLTLHRDGKEVFYRACENTRSLLLHNIIERVMKITCPQTDEEGTITQNLADYSAEQIETVKRMHDELLEHPSERITIEELSRKYLMNPTTLKEVFKAVYGMSIASHMKEHRMERAAELLRCTTDSIGEIALQVGYESSGKFSSAFKTRYHLLPSEYRKAYK